MEKYNHRENGENPEGHRDDALWFSVVYSVCSAVIKKAQKKCEK